MRIIAGAHRGRRLFSVKGRAIRPTSDRVRESIFNILADRVSGVNVLDLFAGTGALGIEALSRGADHACFIDNNRQAILAVLKNINMIHLEEKAIILKWDAVDNLNCLVPGKTNFKLVFMDPPYGKNMVRPALKNLDRSGCLEKNAVIVIEHTSRERLDEKMDSFIQSDRRKYGKTLISFYNYIDQNGNSHIGKEGR